MQQKNYADSDFFLALIKDSDWLNEKARVFYEKNKDNIWVTPFTVAELMIIFNREGIPIKDALYQMSRISKLEFLSWETFFESYQFRPFALKVFFRPILQSWPKRGYGL